MGIKNSTKSNNINIYIGGDVGQIKQVCREYCKDTGFCVTVTPTTYIYTGGEEAGAIVGLINYPRFPSDPTGQLYRGYELAKKILNHCNQKSFTISTPKRTYWFTNAPATQDNR
jgi:hypothetical protein